MKKNIPVQTFERLPLYLEYLKGLPRGGAVNISATAIAEALGFNDVKVRKDLASVSDGGKPKVGYVTESLIRDIEYALGGNNTDDAVIAGVGNLGRALMAYDGFRKYGLSIVVGFDSNPAVAGTEIMGKRVLPSDKMRNVCERMKIRIGIIAVPGESAQSVCDEMVASGIAAVWNFAPVRLEVPRGVIVRDENLAAPLAALSRRLAEDIYV